MELTRDVVELLIAHSAEELAMSMDHKYLQQPASLRRNDYLQMNETLFAFLDKLAHDYQTQRRK
jgi:GMP synthase (glutamine-hydrolysing)